MGRIFLSACTSLALNLCGLALLLFLPASSAFAHPQADDSSHVVWRIGRADHSSEEFKNTGIDYANPKDDAVFHVGADHDADWPRFQPGPANGMAGGREHPYTILFTLDAPPRGVYELNIAILYETPRRSFLRVDVNGHTGLIYFHPKIVYDSADWEETFVPQTSAAFESVALRPEWFQSGENRIVLTALDDPAAVEQSLGSIALGHTGIVYDAIEFRNAPDKKFEDHDHTDVRVDPTIFYKRSPSGLNEIVDVFARFTAMPPDGVVTLDLAAHSYRKEFKSRQEFGDLRVEFEAAEWTGAAKASVAVSGSTVGANSATNPRQFSMQISPAKKWTAFIIPHEHLDIGFTDYPEAVAELHSQSIDDAMQIQKTIPSFRWTLDGYWPVEQYFAARSPEKQHQLTAHLQSGEIQLPLEYSNQHTNTASLESLARSLYDSHFFAKEHHFEIGWAQDVDVPSYTWSYASILHDAGMKYFLGASNNWRAPILLHGRLNELSPFYWEGPDGGRVLMWYSRAYLQMQTLFASPAQIAAVRDALPVFFQAYARADYESNSAIIFGSQLENTALSKEQAQFPAKWNAEYAWPRLQFATVPEAMSAIAKDFHGHIKTYRGDLGTFWEDGFGSDSAFTAMHRANQNRITAAETLGVAPTLLNADLRPDESLLHSAWKNIVLGDEHTWTSAGATTQPESTQTVTQTWLRESRAKEARREISESIERSWAQLTPYVARAAASLAVFNSLNWTRSAAVEADIPESNELIDAQTGKPVVFDTISIGRGTPLTGFGGGYVKIRFLAENVPALGYKSYELRATTSKSAATPSPKSLDSKSVIENQYYRITLDPDSGAIRSVYDKDAQRELVDATSPYRFGQYLYVTGADDMPHNSLYRYLAGPQPELQVHASSQGRIESIRELTTGTQIVLVITAVNTPAIRTEIVLPRDEKKIEFKFSLTKEKVLTKEGVYFAFPFLSKQPAFGVSLQTAWVDPAHDQLPGANKEWFAATGWAAVHDADFSAAVIPIDAPLVTFGDIVRGKWPTEFTPASSTIFSWIMNNYWGTNFVPWQGGDFEFRYTITSGRSFDPEQLTRFAREQMTPLEITPVGGLIIQPHPPKSEVSFLSIDNPSLAIVTWKIAEDGDGTILRLQNISSQPGSAKISSEITHLAAAWRCNLIEDNQSSIPVKNAGIAVAFGPYEILTLRLKAATLTPGDSSPLAAK